MIHLWAYCSARPLPNAIFLKIIEPFNIGVLCLFVEWLFYFEPRQVLRAAGIGQRGLRLLVSVFPFGQVMVVDQAAAAEGLSDELALQPVRIDPEFICSIHDRYPF